MRLADDTVKLGVTHELMNGRCTNVNVTLVVREGVAGQDTRTSNETVERAQFVVRRGLFVAQTEFVAVNIGVGEFSLGLNIGAVDQIEAPT